MQPIPALPFADGSISLGLSSADDTGPGIVARLIGEARCAVMAGFDGVTLSEHHAGFPGYLPNPVLVSAVMLGALERGWACAAPSILPLRNAITVAEDLAWLHSAFPARVGAGFVPGYQSRDFDAVGVDFQARTERFWNGLNDLVNALGGEGESPLADDAAVRALAGVGLPILAGVGGPVGAARAARRGVGLLLMSLRPANDIKSLVDRYRDAGGSGPVVVIRRVHLGPDDADLAIRARGWQAAAADQDWLSPADGVQVTGSAELIGEQLVDAVRRSGCSALNLRLQTSGLSEQDVTATIGGLGAQVLPLVRAELGW